MKAPPAVISPVISVRAASALLGAGWGFEVRTEGDLEKALQAALGNQDTFSLLYVHLEPKEVFFGGGIWHPPNPVLREIREAIVADPAAWKAATRSKSFRARFGEVRGEALKRPPQGFDADHPFVDDLRRKSFFAIQNVDAGLALSKDFAREVQSAFVSLKPMMRFLADAVGVTFDYED